MLGVNYKLAELEEKGKNINLGIVGAGQMGMGMVSQVMLMKGIRPAVVSDIDLDRAFNAYINAGIKSDDIAKVSTIAEANEKMEQGKYIVTDNSEIASKANLTDVAIDATGVNILALFHFFIGFCYS